MVVEDRTDYARDLKHLQLEYVVLLVLLYGKKKYCYYRKNSACESIRKF